MSPNSTRYPTSLTERQQLADDLAVSGLKPTQGQRDFSIEKINAMIDAMNAGSFDWHRASLRPVVLGPNGEILGGHHRILAAHLAGVDLDAVPGIYPQIRHLPSNFRHVYHWVDVLPDVA